MATTTDRPARAARAAGGRLARLVHARAAWVMAVLVGVSFLQRPGRSTFDTKLDLSVDPIAFLGRALHLWNPAATGGELQNQAYGYLFPMGPFFGAGQVLGLSPWVTQRLWCALLLCLAFGGMLALSRALRIGSEPARFAGALAYTLAPRMLTEIGPLSAEMLPAVLLPWVLLPLVRADRIGSPRRAAGLSALAVFCMGGVNGAMVIMALVLPGLWLLTRTWTRDHARLAAWWCVSVLAVTLWWILPLLLLGEYSLPFLDYIESASNTTAPMSLFEVLRGTNQWVAYVVEGTPWWPAGFLLIDNPVLMVATCLVAALGLAGLVRARLPERLFLTVGVVTGLTLLTIGYVGSLDSPIAETVRGLLDGPLAPLRNVHKFEPVLRLPLMLAFTHAVSGRLPGLVRVTSTAWARRARLAVGVLLVAVMAAPAWLGTLRPGPGWSELPDHWRSAMTWLGDQDPDARTLMVPGAGFGDYTWGRTVDEPAQALARSPWAVRSQIPLGSEGNTRIMDAVDDVLADGRGSPALAGFLARAGYRFLMVRNDIDRDGSDAPPVNMIRAGLASSTGIERVAAFGPEVAPHGQGTYADTAPAPALEIFEVRQDVPRVNVVPTEDVPVVSGGPESLLPLLESGLLEPGRPTVFAGDDVPDSASEWLVTDGLRHRERNVGRVRDNLSQTLTTQDRPRQTRPSTDVLPFPGRSHQTVAAYRGIRSVEASTSTAFADAVHGSDPSGLPFAAIDGDPVTAWRSSGLLGPDGQWLEVELDTPREVDEVTMRVVDDIRVGWPVTRLRITTDAGSTEHDVARGTQEQRFRTAPGLTSTVRVTVLSVAANRQTGNAGIHDLTIPGVTPQRALAVPADARPAPGQRASFSFTRGSQPRYACVAERIDGDTLQRCDSASTRFGEEPAGVHRLFDTAGQGTFRVGGTVLPALGGTSPVTLPGMTLAGSSQLAGDLAAGPLSAVDGDRATTWTADVTDLRPTLTLSWPQRKEIRGLRVTTDERSGAARPTQVLVTTPAGTEQVPLDDDGAAELALTTDRVEIAVTGTTGGLTDRSSPAGITELELSGSAGLLPDLSPSTPFAVPCGAGPNLNIDGFDYATSVSGTHADVVAHRPLRLATCDDLSRGVDLPPGEHEVRTDRSPSFVVQDLWLRPDGAAGGRVGERDHEVTSWDVTHRTIEVSDGAEALLSVPENANDGWVATVDGRSLERARVDGWQQAWVLPEGVSGTVALDFVPDTSYRRGLLIGAVTALALVASLFVPVRRRRPVEPRPGGRRWVPVALVGLLGLLGGMLPLVLLIACLLARTLWPPAPKVLALGGAGVACVTAVSGRVLGHGQEWAYGSVSQAALLLAVAAVVSTCVDWFDRERAGEGAMSRRGVGGPRAQLDHGAGAHE